MQRDVTTLFQVIDLSPVNVNEHESLRIIYPHNSPAHLPGIDGIYEVFAGDADGKDVFGFLIEAQAGFAQDRMVKAKTGRFK